jgi:hypothetical protein
MYPCLYQLPVLCFSYFLCLIICLLAAFFPSIWFFYCLLDPDPHSECGSGSKQPYNADPMRIRFRIRIRNTAFNPSKWFIFSSKSCWKHAINQSITCILLSKSHEINRSKQCSGAGSAGSVGFLASRYRVTQCKKSQSKCYIQCFGSASVLCGSGSGSSIFAECGSGSGSRSGSGSYL